MRKYLRIAVTVLSLTACVLLVALWVRSYYYLDEWARPISQTRWFGASSIKGQLRCCIGMFNPAVPIQASDWGIESTDSRLGYARNEVEDTNWGIAFFAINSWTIWGPHWFLALLSASLAVAPWLKWSKRFSLRTLLIAMTLIAMSLGTIILLSR